jgi:hypothetical protein
MFNAGEEKKVFSPFFFSHSTANNCWQLQLAECLFRWPVAHRQLSQQSFALVVFILSWAACQLELDEGRSCMRSP